MYRATNATAVYVVVLVTSANADLQHTLVSPGLGRYEAGVNSSLDVSEIEFGYSVRYFVSEAEANGGRASDFPPSFHATWSSDEWVRFTFHEFDVTDAFHFVFNPYGRPGGHGGKTGLSFLLPPIMREGHDNIYDIGVTVTSCPAPERCANKLNVLEYSVEPSPAPLPGDFNFDDRVDLEDFVILRQHFGVYGFSDTLFVFPIYQMGDANLDGRSDFDDFIILARDFGAVRETSPAAVPEPASAMLLGLALLGLGEIRRRHEYSSSRCLVCPIHSDEQARSYGLVHNAIPSFNGDK